MPERNDDTAQEKSEFMPTQGMIEETLETIVFKADKPIVVSINGGWGEGKTHFWKHYVNRNHPSDKVAYISLFGASSLKEIRQRIITNIIFQTERLQGTTKTGALSRFNKTLSEYKAQIMDSFAQKLGLPDGMTTQLIECGVLREGWIICLDDIERVSNAVRPEELLGYIDELREVFGLKVVLIYNETGLDEGAKKSFKRYHEKVIDRQLPFIPDIKEQIARVFKDVHFIADDEDTLNYLVSKCQVLDLRNIRLLVKTSYFLNEVMGALPENSDVSFLHNVIHSLILFTWVHYGDHKKHKIPNIKYVFRDNSIAEQLFGDEIAQKENDELKIYVKRLLRRYEYKYTADVDYLLADFVRLDVLDKSQLMVIYIDFVNENGQEKQRQHYHNIWQDQFFSSTTDNEDEFCRSLMDSIEAYIVYIALHEIDESMHMLRNLGRIEEAEKIWELFKEKRRDTLERYDNTFRREIYTAEVRSLIEELNTAVQIDNRGIAEVIKTALDGDIIQQRERLRLCEFSVDEYVEYFNNKDQDGVIQEMTKLAEESKRFRDEDPDLEKIRNRVLQAAAVIADKNNINRVRMEYMKLLPKTQSTEENA